MGLSRSPMLAEANDSTDSTVEREEAVSSESEMISLCMMWSSSISESEPDVPKSLFIANFAVSTNHSSSGSALQKEEQGRKQYLVF